MDKINSFEEYLKSAAEAQRWCLGIGNNSEYLHNIGQGDSLSQIISGQERDLMPKGNIPKNLTGDTRFSPGFLAKVQEVATRLQINWLDLLVCMAFETGGSFNPGEVNRLSGATGLIQFMPSTARGLGTTTTALAKMSQVEQMKYVELYLSSKKLKGASFADIYMSIIFPAAVGKPDSYVLFGKNAAISRYEFNKAYIQNKGLDLNKDGSITKGETAAQAYKVGVENLNRK